MTDRLTGGNRYTGLDTPVKYGAWLRARLKEYGVSVSEVADDIGVAPGTVYNWLKGRLPPPQRGGEPDKFEDGLLTHPALALSSSQREHLAVQRRVLVGAATGTTPEPNPEWPQRALPAAVATFTGRYAQLDQLNRLLLKRERGHAVVISALSGLGGVGKTALAVRWAHSPEVRRTFPDGAVYVNLNGFSETDPMTASEAQARLLRQLGVRPRAIPLDADAVTDLYHETLTGKSLLLVLDNARDEVQVRPLLPKVAQCLAIVTSRNRLAGLTVTHDATCLNLDALTPRESARLLRRLLGGVADREPDVVDTLAVACAHLPLALRIAAADHLTDPSGASLGEYVAELAEDRFAKLAVGIDDPATAVVTVLERSYRNLSSDAQRALRLLSAHPGSDWDRYAAAALLDADLVATETRLGELRDHSLIGLVDERYRMHDLTAEYARSHPDTEPAQRDAALCRLWNFYRRAACLAMDHFAPQDTEPCPSPPTVAGVVPEMPDVSRATAWLDAERANLLTAAAYCAETGDSAVVRDLAATIFRYLEKLGHWRDGVDLHRLECAHTAPDDRCRALNRLGIVLGGLESPGAARDLYEQSLTLARRTGDAATEMNVLNNLGLMSARLGLFDEAVNRYQESIVAARSSGDDRRLARTLSNLSAVHIRRGDHDLGIEYCRQALDAARASDSHHIEASTLNNLGIVHAAQGDPSAATDHFRRGLDLARENGVTVIERACLSGLGGLSEQGGHHEQALRYHGEALRLTEQLQDRLGKVVVLNDLSGTLCRLDRLDEASVRAHEALTLAAAVDDPFEQARAHDNLAKTLAARGDTDTARRHWTEALRIFTELDTPEAEDVRRMLEQTPG